MTRHKKVNIFAWVTMAFTCFLSLTVVYWSVIPLTPIVEIANNELHVKNQEVKAGQNLILVYHSCKNRAIPGTVSRYLQDNQVITLPSVESNQPVGCRDYEVPVMIPSNTPTDTYTFYSTVTYKVSPIKTVSYTFHSHEFRIIGKE